MIKKKETKNKKILKTAKKIGKTVMAATNYISPAKASLRKPKKK